jgi:hypothetical protein
MGGKISDGKSVVVTAPGGGVVGGKFYEVDGFLGCAFTDRYASEKVALNSHFTTTAATNRLAGIVTVAKDAGNVIWFLLGAQV